MKNIHFDFIVHPGDAENIMDAVYQLQMEARERLCGIKWEPVSCELSENEKAWWIGRLKHCEELLLKMKNTPTKEKTTK